jgi:hypothetical protein
MLPTGSGKGQIWQNDRCLCDVDYDIDAPLLHAGRHQVQRITLAVEDKHCVVLLRSYGLKLVLADGSTHRIPRPLQHNHSNKLECYVESVP